MAVLRDTVFVVIKPDALAAGKAPQIFQVLQTNGGQLLHVGSTDGARDGAFEDLYKFNLTIRNDANMLGAWWLNQRIYSMAPSIVALVYFPPSVLSDFSAHELVSRLKGPANSVDARPGQLRRDLAHFAPGLNLMHSSDDALSTAREFLIFAGVGSLVLALDRADPDEQPRYLPPLTAIDVIESLRAGGVDLDFVRTLIRLKLRVLRHELPAHSTVWHTFDAEYTALLRSGETFVHRWLRFTRLCRRELDVLAGDDPFFSHSSLTRLLASSDDFSYQTSKILLAQLECLCVRVTEWERLVVGVSMYYADQLP